MIRLARPSALVLAAALVVAGCSPQRALEAGRVLADIAAGPGPSTLKESTPAPVRETVRYRVDGEARSGDLYQSPEGVGAALVLVPGAAPRGKDDPRLVAFAETLARARFAVLVPEIPGLRALRLRPEDSRAVVDAFSYLADRAGAAGEERLGLAAISYAVGPTVLAALDPALDDRVRFVVAIGGYYEIEAVITYFTTGYYRERPHGPWQHRRPNVRGKWLFVRHNLDRVSSARDRALLDAMAARKLDDPDASLADLAQRLGPEGRSIHALLTNRDPERVGDLIAALPTQLVSDLRALDLSRRDLSRLETQLILVHGRDDPVIPASQSIALARAVPDAAVDLYIVDNLVHVELSATDLDDVFTLWRAVYRLLGERGAVRRGL